MAMTRLEMEANGIENDLSKIISKYFDVKDENQDNLLDDMMDYLTGIIE